MFGKTQLTLRKGMEIMRTRIRSADPKTGKIKGAISMMRLLGRDRGLVASNDAITKLWRVTYAGGNRHHGHTFNLLPMNSDSNDPVFTGADFPTGGGIRIWEFGHGDKFSIQTGVSIHRISKSNEPATWEVYATSPFRINFGDSNFKWSIDGSTWGRLPQKQGFCRITDIQLSPENRFFLRAE